jgi:hypothetical protein
MARGLNLASVDKLTVSRNLVIPHFPDVGIVDLNMLSGQSIRSLEPSDRHDFVAIADEFMRRQRIRLPPFALRV